MTPARLKMTGVEKRFGATHALKNVSLEIAPGEVHSLIGENGAGKSTLMKVLSGAYRPDAGKIELDGQPFNPENPLHARRSGIAMIYQELTLAPHLSVEENILLGEEPVRFGWLNRQKRSEMAREALAQLHHKNLPLDAPVNTLTIAQQQLVEIARALIGRPKVLIMDEPTSSLTQVDTENLFNVIRNLRERGVSIIYISHFLEECRKVSDRYTVLRDGETIGSGNIAEVSLEHVVRMMVGRDISEIYPRVPHEIGEPVLTLQSVAGTKKPQSVTCTLRAGEILGIAGLIGAGRTETLRATFGLDRIASGIVQIDSKESTTASPSMRLRQGIGLLSEDRKAEGLMLNRSVADNLTITDYNKLSRFGLINAARQRSVTDDWLKRLSVRTRGASQTIGELSGGNQQKVALGRLLHHDARIFLLDEPTRGIDVGSKAEIYHLIGELAAQGKAVIFVSSYLPELLGVCDTIGVMCRGTLSEIRPAREWSEHSILTAAISQQGTSNN